MKYKAFFYSLLIAGWLSGCVTEYDAPVSNQLDNLLVVEGIITNGTTTISLSRSVGLSGDVQKSQPVDLARVWVENEAGLRFESSTVNNGQYTIPTGELDYSVRYRLRISLGGDEYETDFLEFRTTSPIEEINLYQKESGNPVQVRINTSGAEGQSPYYFWSYEEIWETHAHQMATHYLGIEGNYTDYYSYGYVTYTLNRRYQDFIQEYDTYSPYYICWKYDNSKSLLLGSNDKLTENRITNHVLYEVEPTDDRFSYLYYVKIKQYSLSEDAYNYFNNLKKNAEDIGSIFSPVPSEMRGNIVCTTNPDIPVIGYVEASETEIKERFIRSGETPYTKTHTCDILTGAGDIPETQLFDFYLFFYDQEASEQKWTNLPCIDCRSTGGTKIKPDFWPNDHI